MSGAIAEPVVALDDDPTGAQTLSGVRVLLAWSDLAVRRALEGRRAVHLVTNARALPAEAAAPVVASAASAAVNGAPGAHVLMRGDSTLRGHVLEELQALRQVVDPSGTAPLLLVPALPSAGRVTVGGIHMVERDGVRVPLHDTEYARDGVFSYSDARLLAWAEERTGGLLRARAGRELHLPELRAGGADRVAEIIAELCARGRPSAFAPDAETIADLELIAAGYAQAAAAGAHALVRCAPAFVGVLSGTTATMLVPAPSGTGGVLVVCGSYVPTTTRQLRLLVEEYPGAFVQADVHALASRGHAQEVQRLAHEASRRIRLGGLAVLATPRDRPARLRTLEAGKRVAAGLAAVVARVEPHPPVIVAKGGITSAVTMREGVGADVADVVGPVLAGVSLWSACWTDGVPLEYLVVPGNVGGDDLLLDLVARILTGSARDQRVP